MCRAYCWRQTSIYFRKRYIFHVINHQSFELPGPCEIIPQRDGTSLVYTSAVNWEAGKANAVITRSRMIRVDFQCVFETSYTLSLQDGITPLLEKAEVDLGVGEGNIDVALGLWDSPLFQNPLPADAEISVPEKLHVAAVVDESSFFNVYLDECWATPRLTSEMT